MDNQPVKLSPCQQDVVNYMEENGSITTMEAIHFLHQTRLASRISELVKLGFPIIKNIQCFEKNGRTSHYTVYRMDTK